MKRILRNDATTADEIVVDNCTVRLNRQGVGYWIGITDPDGNVIRVYIYADRIGATTPIHCRVNEWGGWEWDEDRTIGS